MAETGMSSWFTGFELEDLIEVLERRKWWVVGGAIVGLALGAAAYLVLPPEYKATTTILVEPQKIPEAYVQSTVTLQIEQRLSTLRERVTSHANMNDLIDRIGAERFDPSGQSSRESLMSMIRNSLEVNIGGETRRNRAPVFQLAYYGDDPQLVAEVVREIAGLFVAENIKDRTRQADATKEFLDSELDRLREEVTKAEAAMRQFRFDRMGSLPSQLDANLRSLDRLNLELAGNLEAQEASTQRVALLRRQLSGVGSTDAGPNPVLISLRQELVQARRIYTDEHPNVQHLMEEIRRIESGENPGGSAELLGSDPAFLALKAELDQALLDLNGRRRQEQKIRDSITQLQSRVEATPAREQELLTLTRDYDNLTATYRDLLSKKFEATLARNLEQAQKGERFKLLRPARVPDVPSFPDLFVTLPVGMGVGLAFALIGIIVSEFRNPAFRSVDRLSKVLGLPVFASIPRIDNEEIYEVAPSGEVDDKLVSYTAPESAPAEQYRGFLPTFLDQEDCRVLLVTSAARGDGKTLTCMNLAVTLANDLNYRVLVIDCDLRRPRIHRVMHVDRQLGLSSVLKREAPLDECIQNSKIPNVTVLPAGPSVRNPLTLLTSKTFLDLLRDAKDYYDVIFIDSPPLLPVVDTRIIRKMADMVLFVVRADGTPRDAVIRSLRDMQDVAGLVFNQVSPGSFRRYYYYEAYSRYAYGDPTESPEDGDHV